MSSLHRQSFFAERVFQIFDRDNSGTVSLSEFLDAMHQFAGKSPNDKIKFLFRVYDLDGKKILLVTLLRVRRCSILVVQQCLS